VRINGVIKREARKGAHCATEPLIGAITEGYPVAIRSFIINHQEERSNNAQTDLPTFTP